MTKREIFVVLSADDNHARGNIWKMTAKKTDFYLDFEGTHNGGFHLSIHGPNEKFSGHRFHVKADRQAVKSARMAGSFLEHGLGKGLEFDGTKLADHAYLVARLRWTWDLQRPRFKHAALSRVAVPELSAGRSGKMLDTPLAPNSAWDIDVVVSYGEPFWPDAERSARDDSRLGPLENDAGMWLTATSYHRSQILHPSPEHLRLPVPRPGETPQSVLGAGPGHAGQQGMYWFVEGITSQEVLSATAASRGRAFDGLPR